MFVNLSDYISSWKWPSLKGDDMLAYLIQLLGSAYVEIAILILILVGFFMHRRDPRLVVSGVRLARTIIVVLIFFYLMFIWASTVQPTLRSISVFGMFILNLFMLYSLILARMERPYRDVLAKIPEASTNPELIREIWGRGKRFYYLRYAWSSLFSGANPFQFLHTIATDRVRNEIKDQLHHYGIDKSMVSLETMMAYLKSQLACDANLPGDFKDVMGREIDDFGKHPWLQERVNEFLKIATETPEDINFPEWMSQFESCIRESKR
jgi:hypothetical protein